MRPRNIDKLIEKGNPKRRMSLICEYRARQALSKPTPITSEDYQRLISSFRSDYEIKLYKKMTEQETAIRNYLPPIQTVFMFYLADIKALRGLCLLWREYQAEEETYNLILDTLEDEKTRDEIREIIKNRWLVWGDIQTDKEGFIEIVADKPRKQRDPIAGDRKEQDIRDAIQSLKMDEEAERPNLWGVLKALSESARRNLASVKTSIAVTKYFMERTGNRIKTYEKTLDELEAPLFYDAYPLPVFNKEQLLSGMGINATTEAKEKRNRGIINLFSEHWKLFPSYQDIEIDKELACFDYAEYFAIHE